MDPRIRMRSGNGLCSIDDAFPVKMERPYTSKQQNSVTIDTDPTGELTPNGSECGDSSTSELTRTWTLSALQRLSVEEQTTLGRKLGGSGPVSRNKSATAPAAEQAVADSPFRVVLQNAVVQGDLEAAAAALQSGADPNERDDLRHSSLHFAAAKGDVVCLRELMRNGARANVANNVGWSPLHYAVLGGHVEVVEALLRAGAYPCFRDNHLISPLHLASTQTGTQTGHRKTFQQIAELLGPSALLARDELEQTPLHVAASCGNRDAVSVLLELNADPESKDRKGRNPGQSWLRQVSQRARADIRRYLAAAVERRNAVDDDDSSCLSDASSCSDGEDEMTLTAERARVNTRLEKQHSVSSVCSEAMPVARPSMLNLLPTSWGLGNSKKNLSTGGGNSSFGAEGGSTLSGV